MVYSMHEPPMDPPCDGCRVTLLAENEEAALIYMTVRRQYVTGEYGRVVDLSIQAVKIVMDLYGVQDQRRCLEKVLKTFYAVMAKQAEIKDEIGFMA